jgi:predicted nucleotidyltransferase
MGAAAGDSRGGAGPATESEVVDLLRRRLEALPEIVAAFLHGSFVEGGPARDVDVALLLDRMPAESDRYVLDLAADLSLALGRSVDVRLLNGASPAFRYHALQGRPLLERDPEQVAEFRARTWDEYFDFQPFARAYLREVLSA